MDLKTIKIFLQAMTQAPDFQPGEGVTHCNQAARKAAQFFGCHEFDDPAMLADDMISTMESNASGKWQVNDGPRAVLQALNCGLAFAAMTSKELGEAHGHIAVIAPLTPQYSGSLGRDVPMIANVGARNGMIKVSEAFPVAKGEPRYFRWG